MLARELGTDLNCLSLGVSHPICRTCPRLGQFLPCPSYRLPDDLHKRAVLHAWQDDQQIVVPF